MTDAAYTPAVKRLADEVRKLTTGELVALRDALREDFDILPPDIGDREPRRPSPEDDQGSVAKDWRGYQARLDAEDRGKQR